MTTREVIGLAEKHIGKGAMVSSAELALKDAVELEKAGKPAARDRALKSIAYSIGVFSPDYKQAQAGEMA